MAKPQKKVSPHVTCPASPQTLSMGRNFLFCFFLFSRSFCHLGPRMPQNPWKNPKKKVSPHVTCPASPQTHPWVDFFGFLEVFATLSVQQCQSLIFLCVFCFPVSWVPGRNFHPDKHPLASFHSSTFYIGAFIELITDLATEPSKKNYSKNSSVTHLFR